MNKYVPVAAAATAVLVVAVVGYNLLPGVGGPGGQPTATIVPSLSPAPLAVGSFMAKGAQIELDATGDGAEVTGTMTVSDDGGRFTVDLACTRTTDGGLIMVGGLVPDSTHDYAPEGTRVAMIFQRGSPVKAVFWFEHPDPAQASCPAFLESVPDEGDPGYEPSALEPIEGTLELRP